MKIWLVALGWLWLQAHALAGLGMQDACYTRTQSETLRIRAFVITA